jgi:hypothetical protein
MSQGNGMDIVERRIQSELTRPRSMTDLIASLSNDPAIPADKIKPAIWSLTSRGAVTLTWDGTLRLPVTRD